MKSSPGLCQLVNIHGLCATRRLEVHMPAQAGKHLEMDLDTECLEEDCKKASPLGLRTISCF